MELFKSIMIVLVVGAGLMFIVRLSRSKYEADVEAGRDSDQSVTTGEVISALFQIAMPIIIIWFILDYYSLF